MISFTNFVSIGIESYLIQQIFVDCPLCAIEGVRDIIIEPIERFLPLGSLYSSKEYSETTTVVSTLLYILNECWGWGREKSSKGICSI